LVFSKNSNAIEYRRLIFKKQKRNDLYEKYGKIEKNDELNGKMTKY